MEIWQWDGKRIDCAINFGDEIVIYFDDETETTISIKSNGISYYDSDRYSEPPKDELVVS